MTPDERDALYDQAEAANVQVAETLKSYQAATRARAVIFRRLRDGGQSLYKMSKRLGLSTARVSQIVSRGDADPERRQP